MSTAATADLVASSSSSTAIYYNGLFDVPNPEGRLRIAMTAQVNIVLAEAKDALIVPSSALGAAQRADGQTAAGGEGTRDSSARPAPPLRAQKMFRDGQVRLECCVSQQWRTAPEQVEVTLWTEPVLEAHEVLVFAPGHAFAFTQLADLRGSDELGQRHQRLQPLTTPEGLDGGGGPVSQPRGALVVSPFGERGHLLHRC